MKLVCGCDITRDSTVGSMQMKMHYLHTVEALLYWQAMVDEIDEVKSHRLMEASLKFTDTLHTIFPNTVVYR